MRLLVVDDEWLIRKGITQMVRRLDEDWQVEEAANGLEALERLKKTVYDLVLCDIKMPGMDGMKMLETLNGIGVDTPVVFLTGYDDFQLMRNAIRLRAHDYLLKPVHDEDIMTVLSSIKKEEDPIIAKAKAYIHERLHQSLSLVEVANHVHLNPTYFSEYFKEKCGETFSQYVLNLKMEKAKKMLEDPAYRIIDVSEALGYKDPRSFTRMFKLMVGITPKLYRKKSRN